MTAISDDLVGAFQNPGLLIGIPLALLGAVFMSFGAQYQHQGVEKVEKMTGDDAATGLHWAQIKRLLVRPSWLTGTLMLGLAIVCQLGALSFAPLIVVQPLGAFSLVITTLLNAKITGHKPTRASIIAIIECVGGILIFVTIAALYATESPVTDQQLLTVVVILIAVAAVVVTVWLMVRQNARALFYIIAAGTLYGFVATLAKTVLSRIGADKFDWLTLLAVIALISAAALGAYFVQVAYASGPPDLVIAGLTVIDPMVAITIGSLVLGEAAHVPVWAIGVFLVAGGIAIHGVWRLARDHPQVLSESQQMRIARGSSGDKGDKKDAESAKGPGRVAKVWPHAPVHESDDADSADKKK